MALWPHTCHHYQWNSPERCTPQLYWNTLEYEGKKISYLKWFFFPRLKIFHACAASIRSFNSPLTVQRDSLLSKVGPVSDGRSHRYQCCFLGPKECSSYKAELNFININVQWKQICHRMSTRLTRMWIFLPFFWQFRNDHIWFTYSSKTIECWTSRQFNCSEIFIEYLSAVN